MPRFTTVPLPPLQALNARTMQTALSQSAQATIHTDADAGPLVAFREARTDHDDVSLEALVARAVVSALAAFPHINARIGVEGLAVYHGVNLGLMVVLEKGVIVPVVEDADALSLRELDAALREITEKAHSGRLKPSETRRATFTLASLADYGIDSFTPILVSEMIATLGIGRVRAVCEPDETGCRRGHRIGLSLTFDHRAIHGVEAARFLHAISDALVDAEALA